jgi:hypothetical protein
MKLITTLALCAVVMLGGCANTLSAIGLSTASTAADVAAQAVGPIPNQVSDLSDAIRVADLATKGSDVIVKSVHSLTRAQLEQLNAGSDSLHVAVDKLEADNAAGKALTFSSFNAALAAYNTYTAELPPK